MSELAQLQKYREEIDTRKITAVKELDKEVTTHVCIVSRDLTCMNMYSCG